MGGGRIIDSVEARKHCTGPAPGHKPLKMIVYRSFFIQENTRINSCQPEEQIFATV